MVTLIVLLICEKILKKKSHNHNFLQAPDYSMLVFFKGLSFHASLAILIYLQAFIYPIYFLLSILHISSFYCLIYLPECNATVFGIV